MATCWECKDLRPKYKTKSGKRPRYFCSERCALTYHMRQVNKNLPKGYTFNNVDDLKKNKYYKRMYKKI